MLNSTQLNSSSAWNNVNFTSAGNMNDVDFFISSEITAIKLCYGLLGAVGFLENLTIIIVILVNKIMLDCPSNCLFLAWRSVTFSCLSL